MARLTGWQRDNQRSARASQRDQERERLTGIIFSWRMITVSVSHCHDLIEVARRRRNTLEVSHVIGKERLDQSKIGA